MLQCVAVCRRQAEKYVDIHTDRHDLLKMSCSVLQFVAVYRRVLQTD